MEIVCLILGWSLIGIGLLGCFVNKIPGPLMAFLGLLLQVWGCDIEMEWWVLALLAVLVVASMVVSKKLVPKVGNLVAEFGKAGAWGTTVGSLVGLMFFAIVCEDASVGIIIFSIILSLLLLPYLFAFLFELIVRKSAQEALQAAGGALVAFLIGTMLKLAVCVYTVYAVITNA